MNSKQHMTFTEIGKMKAQRVVDAINLMGGEARLGETWMDYGAGISWETILVKSKSLDMDYQALDPRDFEEMNAGKLSPKRAKEIINYAIGGFSE